MVIFPPFSTPLPHPLFFNLSSTPFQHPFSPPSVDIFITLSSTSLHQCRKDVDNYLPFHYEPLCFFLYFCTSEKL